MAVDILCIQKEFQKLNININKFTSANIILIIIASIIGSVGLLTNNYQSVIASKIIGLALIPFIALCIVLLSGQLSEVYKKGLNCLIFFVLCLAISIIIGMINAGFDFVSEPTNEMKTRSTFKYENIGLELIISFIVGIGIYYSITKVSIVAFIGLLLVVSIIPPICNSGLLWGMTLLNSITGKNQDKHDLYLDYANHSMILFLSNISGVFLGFLTAFVFNCI